MLNLLSCVNTVVEKMCYQLPVNNWSQRLAVCKAPCETDVVGERTSCPSSSPRPPNYWQPTICWHECERCSRSMFLACVTALPLGNCCQHIQIFRGGPVVSYYHHTVSDRNSMFSCTPSRLLSCRISAVVLPSI